MADNDYASSGYFFKTKPYIKMNISGLFPLTEVQKGFSRVPLDEYVPDRSRFKDLVRFSTNGEYLVKAPHGELYHPINSKTYGNEMSRAYNEVPDVDIDAIQQIAEFFVCIARIPNNEEILVQRQRVMCSDVIESAKTVREGAHRDGVKKMAITCISRTNVDGGVSFLYNAEQEMLYAGTLEPGDIMFVADEVLTHDATPIKRTKPCGEGYRDIVILTWPSVRNDQTEPEQYGYYGA